jgi:phenylacetate-CoA ligase
MGEYFDNAEIRTPQDRERDLFARLPTFLAAAMDAAPGLSKWLNGIDPATVSSREALADVPVLHKADLMEFQKADPPFGGFASASALKGGRAFLSPGPIWEPQGFGSDPWQSARAFHAAGIRPGDRIHNAFAYHMTPGGFILDEGARSLGCTVFPAGTGNTEMQVAAAATFSPDVYCGTPDFLKVMLDKAAQSGHDLSSIRRALVSGGALFPSLRAEYADRGIAVLQCYATAEFGVIAYETVTDGAPNPGMIVNEDLIVEIVRPGTGDPVEQGEVGEVVVTSFNMAYPMVRLATGDLSAVLPGLSPCGRTNTRITGWMGRADQRTKIKGMFVDPKQIGELMKQHPGIGKARLAVTRANERDEMTLLVEPKGGCELDLAAIDESLREITKLRGKVETAQPGTLPNDGKIIADERQYDS